jgi:hypothetical protein
MVTMTATQSSITTVKKVTPMNANHIYFSRQMQLVESLSTLI